MPSQVTDDLWHEFILYTRSYEQFCGKAFGRFMHHTPAVVLGTSKADNMGLRRVWWYSCKDENIDPKSATRLPLLFAIDKKLGIRNGFIYSADCKRAPYSDGGGGAVHCGGDFSDSSFDGGTDGMGDSDSGGDSGGDSGCGGGCGGD
ncbi:MAG: glycine-rich domain-containing protein [Arenimonas sp.]